MILGRLLAGLMAMAIALSASSYADEESPKADPWDCGTFSLYHLLRLEGRPTDLHRLRATLGTSAPEGHAFRELREAARRCGLTLDAVLLRKQRPAINGPVLLFVKNGRHGHFIVVRPVGHTGRLVQVLDGDRPPVVTDAD